MATLTHSRPRVKPALRVNLIISPTPTMPGIIRIALGDECWTDYNFAPIQSAFGTAFRLVKLLGPHTRYDVNLDGERSTCECKGFLRHGHCKHVAALQVLNREQLGMPAGESATTATTPVLAEAIPDTENLPHLKPGSGCFYLRNRSGWSIAYEVFGGTVTIRRSFRGDPVGSEELTREAARLHYADMLAKGFTTPEGDL